MENGASNRVSHSVTLVPGSSAVRGFVAGLTRGRADTEYWAIMDIFEEMAGVNRRPGKTDK